MRFFTSKNKKLPDAAQKGLLPRKEFITQGKQRFLAAFDASELARNARAAAARPIYSSTFFKIGVGVLALLCIGVGLSAYADTANVSATNPLYPLKRIGESVQLALAPASEKPQLQATFAVRRANEIAALQVSAPSSTLIPRLTSELDQDINTSLGVAEATSSAQSTTTTTVTVIVPTPTSSRPAPASASVPTSVIVGPIDVYCSAFEESTSGVLIGHLEENLALRPNGLIDFNKQCGKDTSSSAYPSPRTGTSRYGHHSINTSTSTATTSSVSSTDHAGAFPGAGDATASNTDITANTTATVTITATTTIVSTSTAGVHVYIPPIKL